ncbi:MAG: UbiD family decarboxylase [Candidatus Aenigmatarchaeota archaeon]|nr:UbiD family decarboxylase [Candidatus Aenigmarchaeota archaeon]
MQLRDMISKLEREGRLTHIRSPVSVEFEMASIMATLLEKPVMFENVKESKFRVVGGMCSSRDLIAEALNTCKEDLIFKLAEAINNLKSPQTVINAPCQEVVESPDLEKLPIMRYMPKDGGKYITSAICVVKDPEFETQNVCFHRLMLIDKNHLVARIVENRGTDVALKKAGGELDIAICIGNSTASMLAAATSLPMGIDEFSLANALERTDLVKCKTVDLKVPANTEIVLEGKITRNMHAEGPFLDLTTTYDKIREQPIIEIKCITHRKDAIYQTLIPGMHEHRILMGMPKEPTIFNEVSKVCNCKNVYITQGGGNWLHAIVQIIKQQPDDGKKAIDAAFKGHGSLKHCVVVDDDINIYDSDAVEWALATRFQGDKDLVVKPSQPGSSLDPSADLTEGKKALTCKVGFDATIPWDKKDKSFKAESYAKVDLKKYM